MITLLLPALLSASAPAGFQSTETLDRLVEQFAGAPIGMEGGARAAVAMLDFGDNVGDIGPVTEAYGIRPIGIEEQVRRAIS